MGGNAHSERPEPGLSSDDTILQVRGALPKSWPLRVEERREVLMGSGDRATHRSHLSPAGQGKCTTLEILDVCVLSSILNTFGVAAGVYPFSAHFEVIDILVCP